MNDGKHVHSWMRRFGEMRKNTLKINEINVYVNEIYPLNIWINISVY